MNYLITGSGGREHALALSLSKNPEVQAIYCMPGNSGTALTPKTSNISNMEIDQLVEWALEHNIDRLLVGSEDLLVQGIVDIFNSVEIEAFGPHKEAAQLEGSKAFSKQFMEKHHICTPEYQICHSAVEAQDFVAVAELKYPIVIKADGLASGKGVLICEDREEAEEAISILMHVRKFGNAGNKIVIEEFLTGFEASIIALYDGNTIVPMRSAMDHKKIFDHDLGPNTGGMGVVVPNPHFTAHHYSDFLQHILLPTQVGLEKEQLQFCGVIFFGVMVKDDKCYLLEYNTRFGDPEIQTLLHLMESDLHTHLNSCMSQSLTMDDFQWKKSSTACCVVMSSGGYPNDYTIGHEISIDTNIQSDVIFAGTTLQNNTHYTNGGRVLNVVNHGHTLEEARNKIYADIDKISFKDHFYRKDIGQVPLK